MNTGQEYWWTDPEDAEFGSAPKRVLIIGYDPFEQKWVGACKDWCFGVSHIDEDDLDAMELIT